MRIGLRSKVFPAFVTTAIGLSACERDRERPIEPQQTELSPANDPSPRVGQQQPGAGTRVGDEVVSPTEQSELAAGFQDQGDPFTVELKSADGVEVGGRARLVPVADGVRVEVTVDKAPSGMKAVHIHEKADCSNIRAESMGGHFAPLGNRHGLPSESEHHFGDLGNIDITNGKGRLERVVPKATLTRGAKLSLLDRALVIHSGKDQGAEAQPSGGSGKPMACAEIKR